MRLICLFVLGTTVCLCLFKVSMMNIMVKAAQRQIYDYVHTGNKLNMYVRRIFMFRSELQGLVINYLMMEFRFIARGHVLYINWYHNMNY